VERLSLGSLSTGTMLQVMLQSALADRCKLVVHRTHAQTSGYSLVLTKNASRRANLKETDPKTNPPISSRQISDGGAVLYPSAGNTQQRTYFGTSMKSLAASLTLTLMIPVVDDTGLQGKYDFSLRMNDSTSLNDPSTQGAPDPASTWDLSQIGLTLRPTKIPVDAIVIDHIEKPSPN
jgi:uncharacterized protein (TIGR03435 family)